MRRQSGVTADGHKGLDTLELEFGVERLQRRAHVFPQESLEITAKAGNRFDLRFQAHRAGVQGMCGNHPAGMQQHHLRAAAAHLDDHRVGTTEPRANHTQGVAHCDIRQAIRFDTFNDTDLQAGAQGDLVDEHIPVLRFPQRAGPDCRDVFRLDLPTGNLLQERLQDLQRLCRRGPGDGSGEKDVPAQADRLVGAVDDLPAAGSVHLRHHHADGAGTDVNDGDQFNRFLSCRFLVQKTATGLQLGNKREMAAAMRPRWVPRRGSNDLDTRGPAVFARSHTILKCTVTAICLAPPPRPAVVTGHPEGNVSRQPTGSGYRKPVRPS